jgi:hypothetical protein
MRYKIKYTTQRLSSQLKWNYTEKLDPQPQVV